MNEANLPRDERGSEHRQGMRAAGSAAARLVGVVVAKHGGGLVARLKSDWAAIVGPELAAATWPESLGRGGTLRLRVAPTKGLEVQHRTPLVIERINLFFGRDAVARVAIVQGPLPLPPVPKTEPPRPFGTREAVALDAQLAVIEDGDLRHALDRLGHAVIGAAER